MSADSQNKQNLSDGFIKQMTPPEAVDTTEPGMPNIWGELKRRGHNIDEIDQSTAPKFKITGGEHYFVVEDLRKRTIKCISCKIQHGGLLEAHMLHRYNIKDGIIYLDGNATTRIPEGFDPSLV